MPTKKPEIDNPETPLEELKPRANASVAEHAPYVEVQRAQEEGTPRRDQAESQAPSQKPVTQPIIPAAQAPQPKAELLLEVEDILSEDLGDIYQTMTPENQRRFKAKGEEVARTIWQMIETAKLHLKKILTLLREWLKMIPGINRYFLEQETKIKIDKIIELAKKEKH